MHRYRHCFIVLLAGFAFLLASIADADAPAARGDGATIRLLVNMAGTQSFPAYVIRRFSLDKKYGFTLETVPSNTTRTTTTAFRARAGDIGIFNWNDLARVKAGGVKILGIAPFLGWANTVVVPVESPIRDLGDLRGKKVGVYSRTSLDWVVMRAVAEKEYKLDLENDIDIQEGAISLLRGLMEQGKLDATQMFNDLTAPMIVSGKFRVLAPIKALVDRLGLPDTPLIMYTVDTDFAAAHDSDVRAFLAAYRDAVDILQRDDTVWADHGKDLNMTDAAVVAKLRELSRPMLMKTFAPDAQANIRRMWAILVATAGAQALGATELGNDFMTLKYQ